MKKSLLPILFLSIIASGYSQNGWELSMYGGANFARLRSANTHPEVAGLGTDLNGGSIGVKGAHSFYKKIGVELSVGITRRENESLWRYYYSPSILGGIGFIYDQQVQYDLENQLRLRYNLEFEKQPFFHPWIAVGFTQMIPLGRKKMEDPFEMIFAGQKPVFKKYEAGLVYAAGVRFRVAPQVFIDAEGNLRHFTFNFGEPHHVDNSGFTRNLMGGAQLGVGMIL